MEEIAFCLTSIVKQTFAQINDPMFLIKIVMICFSSSWSRIWVWRLTGFPSHGQEFFLMVSIFLCLFEKMCLSLWLFSVLGHTTINQKNFIVKIKLKFLCLAEKSTLKHEMSWKTTFHTPKLNPLIVKFYSSIISDLYDSHILVNIDCFEHWSSICIKCSRSVNELRLWSIILIFSYTLKESVISSKKIPQDIFNKFTQSAIFSKNYIFLNWTKELEKWARPEWTTTTPLSTSWSPTESNLWSPSTTGTCPRLFRRGEAGPTLTLQTGSKLILSSAFWNLETG